MADKINPVITVMLDKERHLKLTLGAMLAFQEATGKNLLDYKVTSGMGKKMTLEDLRAMLWSMLRHEDKAITLDEVGDFIDISNMASIAGAIAETWKAALPEGSKEKVPLVKRRPSTGSTSGASGATA